MLQQNCLMKGVLIDSLNNNNNNIQVVLILTGLNNKNNNTNLYTGIYTSTCSAVINVCPESYEAVLRGKLPQKTNYN